MLSATFNSKKIGIKIQEVISLNKKNPPLCRDGLISMRN